MCRLRRGCDTTTRVAYEATRRMRVGCEGCVCEWRTATLSPMRRHASPVASSWRTTTRYEARRHEATHDTSVVVRRTTTRHDAHERRRDTHTARGSRDTTTRHDDEARGSRRAWCDAHDTRRDTTHTTTHTTTHDTTTSVTLRGCDTTSVVRHYDERGTTLGTTLRGDEATRHEATRCVWCTRRRELWHETRRA